MSRVIVSLSVVALVLALSFRSTQAATPPRGKGIFVVSIAEWCIAKKLAYKGSTACAEAYAERIADHGIDWVAIESYKTKKGKVNSDAAIKTLADAILAANPKVTIWIWAWIEPTDADLAGAATRLVATASSVDAAGVMLDVEGKWSQKGRAAEARTLMTTLVDEARAKYLAVGVASYPGFKKGAQIAWDEFARADFGMPMIDTKFAKQSEASLCAWRAHGFARLVPIVYLKSSAKATAKVWADYRVSDGAVGIWSWRNVDFPKNAKKSSANWKLVEDLTLARRKLDESACR